MYKDRKHDKNKSIANKLSVGQDVRLKSADSTQNKFTKSYFVQNTREIFKVSEINEKYRPVTYIISDLEGNKLKGQFYRQELIPVTDSGVYNIKIMKSRVRKGVKETLVKYVDYPNASPKWIPVNELMKKD